MSFQSLDDFIRAAESAGEAKRVAGANRDEDVGCLAQIFDERDGPMLVFEQLAEHADGSQLCVNPIGTHRRIALALDLPLKTSASELARTRRERRRAKPIAPAIIKTGPVFDSLEEGAEIDLNAFPFPRWQKQDRARSGAGDIVVLRDPTSGRIYLELGRVAINGRDRASLRLSPQERGFAAAEPVWAEGKSLSVAVVVGCDPVTWLAARELAPPGLTAYDLAGSLRGAPIDIVELPLTGLPVPAHAELVLEGEIAAPTEGAADGALAEWPGYYVAGSRYCDFRVKRAYHRRKPILMGHLTSRPRTRPVANLEVWDHLERSGIIGITGVWGICNDLLTVVSVDQNYPGHTKQALVTAAGFHHGDMNTFFMTVDDDIDPSNLAEVIWAMCTRVDPGTDIDIVRHVGTAEIDPRLSTAQRSAHELTVGRCLLDATKPYHWRDQFPKSNMWGRADRKEFEEKYHYMLARIGRTRANI